MKYIALVWLVLAAGVAEAQIVVDLPPEVRAWYRNPPDYGGSCVQCSAEDGGGERGNRGGLYLGVQPLMVGVEALVVAAVARLGGAVDGYHEPWADIGATPDAAGYLDVLSSGLGLSNDGHQAKAVDVDSDLDDVRGEADVDSILAFLSRGV